MLWDRFVYKNGEFFLKTSRRPKRRLRIRSLPLACRLEPTGEVHLLKSSICGYG